jgi:hypothetical protein
MRGICVALALLFMQATVASAANAPAPACIAPFKYCEKGKLGPGGCYKPALLKCSEGSRCEKGNRHICI